MSILAWIVVGLIAGFLASLIMRSPNGWLADCGLGIVGALVGGFIFNLFGHSGATGINVTSIIVATIGAVVVLAIYRAVTNRRVV